MVDNLIRLFDSAETEFNSNGLGILVDAESCFVSEERNGAYELELVYPVKGRYFSDIQMRRIIVAKPNPFANPQPFRIYSITKPFNGLITVNAEHISYDLVGYPVDIFEATSCADALIKIKEKSIIPCPFNFWTDKDVSKEYSVKKPFNIRSLLGGADGSILSAFGKGEYEFDLYSVKLWLNRGKDRGVVIRYGKNLTDLKQEENCSKVYTGVCPFWYNENVGITTLPEKIVNAEGTFNYKKILTLDMSDRWTAKPKEDDLRTAAQNYIKDNNIGVPDVSLDISFEQLAQTNEYKLYSLLEEVHLCDTVHVEFPDLGVSAKADCIKTVYNVITNKYKKIELGSAKSSLSSTIANQKIEIDKTPTKSFLEQSIDRATKLITGNVGGYVVMRNSDGGDKPNEILVMDTDDIFTAKKVWRWNNSGLGYSSTGYNGPYGLAMTIDGEINANYITTGTLRAVSIRACDIKCGKIEEQQTRMAVENAEEEGNYAFELASDGSIKATKGEISGWTITDKKIYSAYNSGHDGVGMVRSGGELRKSLWQENSTSPVVFYAGAKNDSPHPDESKDCYFGVLQDGSLYAQAVKISGTITANAGVIGGCEIDENGQLKVPAAYVDGVLKVEQIDSEHLKLTADQIEVISENSTATLTETLKSYVTSSGLETTLESYETTEALTNTLKSYVTSSVLKTELTSYAPQNGGVSSTFGYSLTSENFKLYSGSKEVFIATKDGVTINSGDKAAINATKDNVTIGGWTVTDTRIYSAHTSGNDGVGMIHSGGATRESLWQENTTSPVVFYAGAKDNNPYPDSSKDCYFGVLQDGSLYAQAVKISGTITANAGSIAGIEIGTETRSIENISITGSVLKTPDADNNFSIFSYNYEGRIGSVLKVKSIDLAEPSFDVVSASTLNCTSVRAGNILLKNGIIFVNDKYTIDLNNFANRKVITATLDNSSISNKITVSLTESVSKEVTFRLRLHVTWGGWKTVEMTFQIGDKSKTQIYGDTFWGYDDAMFEESGSKTLTYTEGVEGYIDFNKSIEPFGDDEYNIGSSDYKWKTIWATNGTIQTSDKNEKKDIVSIGDRYDELFDSLKPVSYRFKKNTYNRIHLGFIAQDIRESLDSLNIETSDFAGYCDWTKKDGTTGYGLRYSEFIALNTYEIQKLKKRVAELEQQLQNNKGEIQNGEC